MHDTAFNCVLDADRNNEHPQGPSCSKFVAYCTPTVKVADDKHESERYRLAKMRPQMMWPLTTLVATILKMMETIQIN
jgi:hypothetical protein